MTGWELDTPRDPELIGGPRVLAHYPRGWGMASNTPFRLYKRSTHAGGVRVPMIVSWLDGVPSRGPRRHPAPVPVRHRPLRHGARPRGRRPGREGRTARASPTAITGGATESTHREQYSECFGNRSFYRDGWKLVANHQRGAPYDDEEWELYDLEADPTEIDDLAAAANPEKVRELSVAWEAAAWDNQVFPLDDGTGLLQLLRRPDDARFHEPVRILPGTPTLERYRSQRLIAFRSFALEVELVHGAGDAGVLVAHGDQGGGYSLYVDGRRADRSPTTTTATSPSWSAGPLAPGPHSITLAADATGRFLWDFAVRVDERRGRLTARGTDPARLRTVPGDRRGHRPALTGRLGGPRTSWGLPVLRRPARRHLPTRAGGRLRPRAARRRAPSGRPSRASREPPP